MWKSLILPLLAARMPHASAPADDEINVSKGGTLAGPGLAAHGYDVVAFFTEGNALLGSDANAVAHNGGTYRFASKANLDTFKQSPARYEPAYGGFCAYGVALGKKFDGDPRFWKIVDGKLYLNLNGDIQTEWSKDVPGNVAKAEKNWARIHGVAAASL
jgi:hypothetical protein